MSIFHHRKPVENVPHRDVLETLRQSLEQLNSQEEETPRIAGLRRILAARIAEIEHKSA